MPDSLDTPTTSFPQQPVVPTPAYHEPCRHPGQPETERQPAGFGRIMILVAVLALMMGLIGYQQMEINRLSTEIGSVSNGSMGLRGRLDAVDTKLQEVNARLTYLDSKINATDQKAQTALERIKAQENSGNVLGNWINQLGKGLGLNR